MLIQIPCKKIGGPQSACEKLMIFLLALRFFQIVITGWLILEKSMKTYIIKESSNFSISVNALTLVYQNYEEAFMVHPL